MSKRGDEWDNRHRVVRGGCWDYTPANARVAARSRSAPGNRYGNLGVRLVRRRSALEWLAESLREVSDGQKG